MPGSIFSKSRILTVSNGFQTILTVVGIHVSPNMARVASGNLTKTDQSPRVANMSRHRTRQSSCFWVPTSLKTSPKQRTTFQSLLSNGTRHVTVCRSRHGHPISTSIVVIYEDCVISCGQYLGVSAICFLPPLNSTCTAEAPSDPILCTDQTQLIARLVTNNIKFLNAAAAL